jgi:hypothetical protein
MPNLPISQLPTSDALTGAELFAVVQSGVTKYTTLNNILYGKAANNYGLFNQTGDSTPVLGNAPTGSLIDGGVGTLSVPANGFQVGDAFVADFYGGLTANQNHTLDIKIESDGTNLADTGVITMPNITNKNWNLHIKFSINAIGAAGVAEIASAGTFTFRTDSSGDVVTEIFSSINNTTFDTTIPNTLEVKAIWANSDASDSIYSRIFTLKKVY